MLDLAVLIKLPPEEAIKFLAAKGYTFSFDWHEVLQGAHRKAFTVAKAMRADILADIRQAVEQALAEGETLQQFRRELTPKLKAKGWWGKVPDPNYAGDPDAPMIQLGSPRRLKTIYRTNLQTAYMAGRWQTQVEGQDDRPYLQYVAVLDSRTRASHQALDKLVFSIDDPFWADFYPPNGWGCRCRVRSLSGDDVERRGLTVGNSEGRIVHRDKLVSEATGELLPVAEIKVGNPRTGQPIRVSPDVGWSYNPGTTDWQGNAL